MRYYDYIIADTRIRCNRDLVAIGLNGFKPFFTESHSATSTATIIIDKNNTLSVEGQEISTSYLTEANSDCRFIRTPHGYSYIVVRRDTPQYKANFNIDTDNNLITCNIALQDNIDLSILRFGIWVMFGIVIAPLRGIAIHSSAIAYNDFCALFLGESGTGKSTHTRLWRENIEGAHLLNDDSPILRVIDGKLYAYGSPWSGKTPCYINRRLPIAGLVRLSQAPYNEIKRINTLMAIGALLPSCPHIFSDDDTLQDELCITLGEVITLAPVYTLACLPDRAAAELSCATLFES